MGKETLLRTAIIMAIIILEMGHASAYIDPGTTGLVLNSAWSYIIGFFGLVIGYVMVRFVNPVRRFIMDRIRKR